MPFHVLIAWHEVAESKKAIPDPGIYPLDKAHKVISRGGKWSQVRDANKIVCTR